MSLRALTPGPSRLIPSALPLPTRRHLTIPHPDLHHSNGSLHIRVRTVDRIPSFLHAFQIVKHLETKFSTPITKLDLPKDNETLLPMNTMLVTFLRPVKITSNSVLDIPYPEISDRSNLLGGPSLEDLDKILSGDGGGKEVEVEVEKSKGPRMQFSLETAKPGTYEVRRPYTRSKSAKEHAEDEEILDALEKLGSGWHGGFEGVLEKLGRTRKIKVEGHSGKDEKGLVLGDEASSQPEEIPDWTFDIKKATKNAAATARTESPPTLIVDIPMRQSKFRLRDFKAAPPLPPPAPEPVATPPPITEISLLAVDTEPTESTKMAIRNKKLREIKKAARLRVRAETLAAVGQEQSNAEAQAAAIEAQNEIEGMTRLEEAQKVEERARLEEEVKSPRRASPVVTATSKSLEVEQTVKDKSEDQTEKKGFFGKLFGG